MPQAYSFYPSPKRRFAWYMTFVMLIALGRIVISGFEFERILGIGISGLIVSFIFAYDNRLSIKIARGNISGPSLSGSKHVEFGLASIDKHRTKKQSLWNKLNGRTIIYAKNGEKILIEHTAFDKSKRAEILDSLKLNEYP